MGFLAVLGLVLLQWAWRGGEGFRPTVLAAGVIGPVLLVLAARRILPQGTFSARPGLPGLIATRAMIGATIVLGEAWISLELIHGGSSAAEAGVFVSSGAIGWLLGALLQTKLSETDPAVRSKVVLGSAVLLTAFVLVCGAGTAGEWLPLWVLAVVWFVCGICGGLIYTSVAVLIFGPHIHSDHPSPAAALQSGEALASATMLAAASVAFRLTSQYAGEYSAFMLVLCLPAAVTAVGALAIIPTVRQLSREQAERSHLDGAHRPDLS
ncbi:MAG: hypothetical protein HZY75_00820 [Nocardioidaceae bacterium]|nr:MAG: hypothetical protein HZY75_00820 [Nocardioidaceae bacterium]